jgi:hypothetical protein
VGVLGVSLCDLRYIIVGVFVDCVVRFVQSFWSVFNLMLGVFVSN